MVWCRYDLVRGAFRSGQSPLSPYYMLWKDLPRSVLHYHFEPRELAAVKVHTAAAYAEHSPTPAHRGAHTPTTRSLAWHHA